MQQADSTSQLPRPSVFRQLATGYSRSCLCTKGRLYEEWSIYSRSSKIRCDQRKLIQCGLQVFGNLRRNHIGIRQIGGVLQAFIFKPEDIEVHFVAFQKIFVCERLEAFGFFARVPVLSVVVADEIIQVFALQ
jgi:hypothetical protein